MKAQGYVGVRGQEREMEDYDAGGCHHEAALQQLYVDCTLQDAPQEDDAVVAEAFLYYAVCMDNLPRDSSQTQLALACLERSRDMFSRLADAAEAAGGAEAQGQQVSPRSQEARALLQLSLHWFGYWKEVSRAIKNMCYGLL